MPLTQQQVKTLKEQLLSQTKNLPKDKKAEARKQIEALSPQALELMLKQQEMKESIFRLIVNGKIPSIKVEENEDAIAVLEINPISKGHTIIIQKKPAKSPKDFSEKTFTLAKKLSGLMINKLKANSTEIQTETKFGETILNIIPIYDKQLNKLNINSPRKSAKKEELEEIARKLKEEQPKIETIKIKKEKQASQPLKLKRKIP